MTWDYINGFFDADGSVYYTPPAKSKKRTTFISFTNNEEIILKKIKAFLFKELGINGFICAKKPTKDNHQISYDLKHRYISAIKLLEKIQTFHPKKRHRKNVLLKIHKLIPRNGKYTEKVLTAIKILEDEYK